MISNPTPQRALRGHKPARPAPRIANSADHQARLAARLTPRDRWIIRMLFEHRVLTSHQITDMAFPSFRSGRQRLRELYTWSVLDRFQPFITVGTAPMHYVLGTAGAAVLAAEEGVDPKDLGYRHDRAFAVAHSLQLAHTIGVNEFFTALVVASQAHADSYALRTWWSELRCAKRFGDLVRPDAYGHWTAHDRGHDRGIDFYLEYDFGTEPLDKLATKLHAYAALAAATGSIVPVLVWLPTTRREATARRELTHTLRQLDDPDTVPVATANPELLDPDPRTNPDRPSPAEPIWLPLHSTTGGRRALHDLPAAWPQSPGSHPNPSLAYEPYGVDAPTEIPPPSPIPPKPPLGPR